MDQTSGDLVARPQTAVVPVDEAEGSANSPHEAKAGRASDPSETGVSALDPAGPPLEDELDAFQEREKEAGEAHEKHEAEENSVWHKHKLAVILGSILVLIAIVGAVVWWLASRGYESTDDAFVQGRPYPVSPRIAGTIVDVPVTDNQMVNAGQPLIHIDRNDFQTALDQANARFAEAQDAVTQFKSQIDAQLAQINAVQAQVDAAKAAQVFAQQQQQRSSQLLATGSGTVQQEQQNRSNLQSADAQVNQQLGGLQAAKQQVDVLRAQAKNADAQVAEAKAARDQGDLNLSYTNIAAAQRGRVSQLTAAKGQYVAPGQALMTFVPDEYWVIANFKETQINHMKSGDAVDMTIDAYPSRKLHGHVDSIQSGSGTAFSLLPAQNATGNYVKVVQRIPVKIVFDDLPDDIVLGPGMSVTPKVRVQ